MYFVYSSWYIVLALLLVAIIALIVTFIMMDKKDRVLIEEFVKNSAVVDEDSKPNASIEDENIDSKNEVQE